VHADLLKIPHFNLIKEVIIRENCEAYFIGGCVRDIILGRDVHDVDLVCFSHEYHDFANILKSALPSVWVEFKDNVRLVRGKTEIDISKPRGKNLDEDLRKRDFTINNLGMDITGKIYGTMDDLDRRVIRHVSESTFTDDPIRILRVFRFLSQLGFHIAQETLSKAGSERQLLESSASERIFSELDKLFKGSHAQKALSSMADCGVYDVITFGMKITELEKISAGEGRGLVFFASALFSRLDKQMQDMLAGRLNFPNAVKKRASRNADFAVKIKKIIASGSDAEIMKIIYAYPEETDDGLKLFELQAICAGTDPYSVDMAVDRVMTLIGKVDFELPEKLNGTILSEIGIAPGPLMGTIIKNVRPLMASGEITSLDAAESYIKEKYL